LPEKKQKHEAKFRQKELLHPRLVEKKKETSLFGGKKTTGGDHWNSKREAGSGLGGGGGEEKISVDGTYTKKKTRATAGRGKGNVSRAGKILAGKGRREPLPKGNKYTLQQEAPSERCGGELGGSIGNSKG